MSKPKTLIVFKGPTHCAFKDAPGWYVFQWALLGTVNGINAHGYEITAGPFETEEEAKNNA